jgi:hypothetical protein
LSDHPFVLPHRKKRRIKIDEGNCPAEFASEGLQRAQVVPTNEPKVQALAVDVVEVPSGGSRR